MSALMLGFVMFALINPCRVMSALNRSSYREAQTPGLVMGALVNSRCRVMNALRSPSCHEVNALARVMFVLNNLCREMSALTPEFVMYALSNSRCRKANALMLSCAMSALNSPSSREANAQTPGFAMKALSRCVTSSAQTPRGHLTLEIPLRR